MQLRRLVVAERRECGHLLDDISFSPGVIYRARHRSQLFRQWSSHSSSSSSQLDRKTVLRSSLGEISHPGVRFAVNNVAARIAGIGMEPPAAQKWPGQRGSSRAPSSLASLRSCSACLRGLCCRGRWVGALPAHARRRRGQEEDLRPGGVVGGVAQPRVAQGDGLPCRGPWAAPHIRPP
jgi:hypothetical protein